MCFPTTVANLGPQWFILLKIVDNLDRNVHQKLAFTTYRPPFIIGPGLHTAPRLLFVFIVRVISIKLTEGRHQYSSHSEQSHEISRPSPNGKSCALPPNSRLIAPRAAELAFFFVAWRAQPAELAGRHCAHLSAPW